MTPQDKPVDAPAGAAAPRRADVDVILRFYQAFNSRDHKTLTSLISKDHIDHTYFGGKPIQPEALARAISGMWDVFPDWHESVDEIVPGEGGTVVVRATGRGTQAKPYLGRPPTGKQIAVPLINILRIKDGQIAEYRSTFPFTVPWDEEIIDGDDVQSLRAEQGGLRISEGNWLNVLREFADGRIDLEGARNRKGELPVEESRCQTLMANNLRRCANPAQAGSLYCSLHQEPGEAGGFGA